MFKRSLKDLLLTFTRKYLKLAMIMINKSSQFFIYKIYLRLLSYYSNTVLAEN